MSRDAPRRGERNRRRIDIREAGECRFWAERLGVCPMELAAAVDAVGDEVNDVWLYLDRLKHEGGGRRRDPDGAAEAA